MAANTKPVYSLALIKRGTVVFDELRHGMEELAFLADPAVGELRMGSSESMAAGVLPAIVDRFSRQYPRVALSVVQTVLATLQYRELRQREIDLLLGRIAVTPTEDDFAVEPLYESVVVVGGKSSRWACARKVKVPDLINERWILPPTDSPAGELVIEFFRAHGLEAPHAAVTTLSIHLCVRLLATGRFIATLLASILRFSGEEMPLDSRIAPPATDRDSAPKEPNLESRRSVVHPIRSGNNAPTAEPPLSNVCFGTHLGPRAPSW